MDWIKSKTVRMIACIALTIAVAFLVIGGISPDTLTDLITKVVAVIGVVIELIAKIIEIIGGDDTHK